MKLTEAMRKVWEEDKTWMTKTNVFQWITMFLCGIVVTGPGIFVMWFGFLYKPETPWVIQLPISFVCAVWALFWFRILHKWWPF